MRMTLSSLGDKSTTKMATRTDPQAQMSQIQRQIQQDWANREYIEVITCSIKKISDFLNSFGKFQVIAVDILGMYRTGQTPALT